MSDHTLVTELPTRTACQIIGVTKSQYYDWRQMKLLPAHEGSARMSQREAVHVAVLHMLCSRLGGSFGRMAFRNVRDDLGKTIGSKFEIVWVEGYRSARLVHSDSELAEAVRINAAVLVITPEDELTRLTKAWTAELEDRLHNTAAVKRTRRKGTSQAV
jgi:hypothetical protein